MKFYEIKAGAAGMPAKVWYEAHNGSQAQAVVRLAFYADQASPPIDIARTFLLTKGTKVVVSGESVAIPENAKYLALSVDGIASTYFYRLDVNELPFVEREFNGTNYFLQNGYLAFSTLQPNFYTFDLPSRNVEINGAAAYVQGIQKKKKQEVKFPMQGNPNLTHLVKTSIGNGTIEKMSLTLSDRMAKTTLKYDTE